MKKKLNTENITNELEGASLFFTKSATPPNLPEPEKSIIDDKTAPKPDSPISTMKSTEAAHPEKTEKIKAKKVEQTNNRDTMTPRYHDTVIPRYQETIFPIVRKAVKELGKEAATHRFTIAEKKAISDILYTYKNNGIKTSENEIARISVNFIIEDYKQNGENSILHKILEALNE